MQSAGAVAVLIFDQSASSLYLTAKDPTAPWTLRQKRSSISATVPTWTVEKSNGSTRKEFLSGVGARPMSVLPKSSSKRSLSETS